MQIAKENKVPKLRFGEFVSEWKTNSFEKLLKYSRLGGNYANNENPTGNPLIKMGNLGRGNISLNKVKYIKQGEDLDEKDLIKYGDLFFNTRNTLDLVGKVAIWKNELSRAFYNSNLMCIEFDNNFFMNYRLNSFKGIKALRRLATGTTSVAAIYTKDLLKLKLIVPCLPEQQKVASFLSAIDDKIQQITKKAALLEEYKKGIMYQIFSQKLCFKDDLGNSYPNWEEKRIGEVFEERNEKNFINMELLSISINKGIFRQSESNKKDNSNSDKSKYKRVLIGDIAYNSMRMWQGASAVSKLNGIISPAYTVLKSNNFNCSEYFGYLFKMSFMIQTFQKHSQGLTSDTWNLKYQMISKIKINVPSLEEQQKIANFLSSLDSKIALVSTQIENTKAFKKGLLQQMFV